jgi:SAM-dependent methyltransferase
MPEQNQTSFEPAGSEHDGDPRAPIWDLLSGSWKFAALHAFVDLRCADHLQDGPLTVEELADRAQADPTSLGRLLRTAAALRLVTTVRPGTYALTDSGAVLCATSVDSMRPGVVVIGEPTSWAAMGALAETVRSGKSPIATEYGSLYEYYHQHPELLQAFEAWMTSRSRDFARDLVAAHDFAGVHTIADIGGGSGTILAAVLEAAPQARGILFELAHVLPGAKDYLATRGLTERCDLVAGDFFTAVPAGADVYLLGSVIHNWDDDDALRILRSVREAITGDGYALFLDFLLPDDDQPHIGKFMDMRMLAVFGGGRERTRAQYLALLDRAGLRADQITALPAGAALIRASRLPG